MMRHLRVSAYLAEDVALDERVYLSDAGEPYGWLHLGTDGDVALWGSSAGLRRVAAGLVLLAERADDLGALRLAASGNGAGPARQGELSGVRGS